MIPEALYTDEDDEVERDEAGASCADHHLETSAAVEFKEKWTR